MTAQKDSLAAQQEDQPVRLCSDAHRRCCSALYAEFWQHRLHQALATREPVPPLYLRSWSLYHACQQWHVQHDLAVLRLDGGAAGDSK